MPTPGAEALTRLISEDDLTATVVEMATMRGWYVYHTRPARRKGGGWRTATQGHTGFPDLIAVRGSRLLVAELKRVGQKPTGRQRLWLEALRRVPGCEVYVWTPADTEEIEGALG